VRTPASIRVMVVDDHPVVREGLARIIDGEADMDVVGEADDGPGAVAGCATAKPDIVVMDVSAPEQGGLEAMATIRGTQPDVQFVVFSVHKGEDDVNRACQAGASGYLFKVVRPDELVAAIRSVAGGGRYLPITVDGPSRSHDPR